MRQYVRLDVRLAGKDYHTDDGCSCDVRSCSNWAAATGGGRIKLPNDYANNVMMPAEFGRWGMQQRGSRERFQFPTRTSRRITANHKSYTDARELLCSRVTLPNVAQRCLADTLFHLRHQGPVHPPYKSGGSRGFTCPLRISSSSPKHTQGRG